MYSALLVITEKLKETGMSTKEIDHLLAKFLEEEAFGFVKFIEEAMDALEIDNDSDFSLSRCKYLS